jgi:hypothetical protein
MRPVLAIFKREFAAYFATPLAYVFIVIFLFAMGAFTFYVGRFYDNGIADLSAFFTYHPWLYLFLVPAIAMRLWAEERRTGTMELLLTLDPSQRRMAADLVFELGHPVADAGDDRPVFVVLPLDRQEAEDLVDSRGDRGRDRQDVVEDQRAAGHDAKAWAQQLGRDEVSASSPGEELDDLAVTG